MQNLGRLNEQEESDRQGVFKILGIFENIISLEPKYAQDIALKTDILPWLLKRLQVKGFDANIGYASEILSILLQDDRGMYAPDCQRQLVLSHGNARYPLKGGRIGRRGHSFESTVCKYHAATRHLAGD